MYPVVKKTREVSSIEDAKAQRSYVIKMLVAGFLRGDFVVGNLHPKTELNCI